MTSKQLVVGGQARGLIPQSFEEIQRVANMLVKAGMGSFGYKDDESQKVAKATAQIMAGLELGIPPMQALSNIAVINGKPLVYGSLVPALIHRAGHHYNHWIEGEGDAMKGVAVIKRRDGQEFRAEFSVEDAKAAKLWDTRETVDKYGKRVPNDSPWHRYQKDMLRWRACGRVVKVGAPDVMSGVWLREEFVGQDGRIEGAEPIDITDQAFDIESEAIDIEPIDGGDIGRSWKGRPTSKAFQEIGGATTFNALKAEIESLTSKADLLQIFRDNERDGLPWAAYPVGWAKMLQEAYRYALKDAVDDGDERDASEPEHDVNEDHDDGSFARALRDCESAEMLAALWEEASEEDQDAHRSLYMERFHELEPSLL